MFGISRAFFLRASFFVLAAGVASLEANATDFGTNVGFVAPDRNPFASGQAFHEQDSGNLIDLTLDANIPPTGLNATEFLADLLGIDARIASARLGGHVRSRVRLAYHYYISGGSVSFVYPGIARLSVGTLDPTGNRVNVKGFEIKTSFLPGLKHPFIPITDLPVIGGAGYGGAAGTKIKVLVNDNKTIIHKPTFASEFPGASASATFYYDGDVDAQIRVEGVNFFGTCIACVSKTFNLSRDNVVFPLVEIDPFTVRALGQDIIDLNKTYAADPLYITPRFPAIALHGVQQGNSSVVAARGESPIITIAGELTDAVPVIGPLLSNNAGTWGYTLGAVRGGPVLNLFQEMSLDVKPRAELKFSEPMRVSVAGGPYITRTVVDFALGETLQVIPTVSARGTFTVQQRFFLNNTFTHTIGLGVDVDLSIDGPTISAPFGKVGPVGHESKDWGIAKLPVVPLQFSLDLKPIVGTTLTFKKSTLMTFGETGPVSLSGWRSLGAGSRPGLERYRLTFSGTNSRTGSSVEVEGAVTSVSHPGLRGPQRVLTLERDAEIVLATARGPQRVQLGRDFCLGCADLSRFFEPESPSFTDSGDRLYIAKLDTLSKNDLCIACDPVLGKQNVVASKGTSTFTPGPAVPWTPLTGLLGLYPAARDVSGTAWQPDASFVPSVMTFGDWKVTAHALVNGAYDWQDGARGDEKAFVSGRLTVAARYAASDTDIFNARVTISPDAFMGKRGYPLLLASGGTADGLVPLVDREAPRDFFTEVAASYTHVLGGQDSLFVYGGLPGEAAFGPAAHFDRLSARDDPEAPLSHRWFGAHAAGGVISAGWVHDNWKLDASGFNGRGDDHNHFDIEPGKLDSASVRLSWNPDERWALQASWAHVASPDVLSPSVDEDRWSASVAYAAPIGSQMLWSTMVGFGRRARGGDDLDAWLLESALHVERDWTIWLRGEQIETATLGPGPARDVAKVSIGAIRDFGLTEDVAIGIGALYAHNVVPTALETSYGGDPGGAMVFVRLKVNE